MVESENVIKTKTIKATEKGLNVKGQQQGEQILDYIHFLWGRYSMGAVHRCMRWVCFSDQ